MLEAIKFLVMNIPGQGYYKAHCILASAFEHMLEGDNSSTIKCTFLLQYDLLNMLFSDPYFCVVMREALLRIKNKRRFIRKTNELAK